MLRYIVIGGTFAFTLLLSDIAVPDVQSGFFAEVTGRFRPFEPNYAIWQYTDNDDDALEARFSFKYLFSDPCDSPEAGFSSDSDEKSSFCASYPELERTELFLKYTGEFDFYWGSRFSAPVINRASNPAIHLRRYTGGSDDTAIVSWEYVDFAVQHLSNGQTQNPNLLRDGQTRAQAFFEIDPHSPYFDTISRSVNFVSIETSLQFGRKTIPSGGKDSICSDILSCYNLRLRLIPWYLEDDNPVTWGPDAGRRSKVGDFDRLLAAFSKNFDLGNRFVTSNGSGFTELEIGLEWTIGDDLFDTDSFDFYLFFPYESGSRWRLPFYVRYHNGPMNNLSNFTKKQSSIGIGFRLY